MRLALLLYMTTGLVLLAIGHRKWWAETEQIVRVVVDKMREDRGDGPQGAMLTARWVVCVVLSLCYDWPLWPRAVWRWWLR